VLGEVDALYNFACHLTRHSPTAEDLAQDTVVRALAASHTYLPGSNIKAWLFRILRNIHLDAVRREKRSPFVDGAKNDSSAEDEGQEILRGDIEIEQLRRLVAADIDEALSALNEESRSVILLDLEGFNEREIAEIMYCAAGTVKSRLARARVTLRNKLREYAK